MSNHDGAVSALAGVNAAVVGLLAAALYDPVWTSAVLTPVDFFVALVGFLLLTIGRVSVLVVLAWCVLASMARIPFAEAIRGL
jgi:chromate transporter